MRRRWWRGHGSRVGRSSAVAAAVGQRGRARKRRGEARGERATGGAGARRPRAGMVVTGATQGERGQRGTAALTCEQGRGGDGARWRRRGRGDGAATTRWRSTAATRRRRGWAPASQAQGGAGSGPSPIQSSRGAPGRRQGAVVRRSGEVAPGGGDGQRRGSNDGGGLGCLDPDGIGRKRGRVGNEEEWGTGCRLGFGQGGV